MAWHDGEHDDPTIVQHLESCDRCWSAAHELAAVDRVVRASGGATTSANATSPRVPGAQKAARTNRTAPLQKAGILAVVALVVGVLAVPAIPASVDLSRATLAGMLRAASPNHAPADAKRAAAPKPATAPNNVAAARSQTAAPRPGASARPQPASGAQQAAIAQQSPVITKALRIGVPVPDGVRAESDDALQVIRAVRAAVDAANANGGVAARPVTLDIVDAATVATGAPYDVLVGGIASTAATGEVIVPGDKPWILPADPRVSGSSVLVAEPDAADAGRAVSATLTIAPTAPIAVLDDSGASSAFGRQVALTRRGPVATVAVPVGQTCDSSISSARKQQSAALVFALEDAQLRRCLDALARAAWMPSGGVLLPSYAAFSAPDVPFGVRGAAALPLPWSSWNDPGVTRFRTVSGGATSYRALVSFAATELAIAIARENAGHVDLSRVASHPWRSDLFSFDGTRNIGLRPAQRTLGGWSPIDPNNPG
jgi:hypothetical protein